MRVLNIAGLAIIFALVRSTTSTASGQRWATKPYENPGGYARSAMRPNVHAPHIHKRNTPIPTTPGQHSLPVTTETITVDHPKHHHQSLPVMTQKPGEANIHKPPHTGMTSTMSGQHSQPDSTETMTDDHPRHHHRPRPVMTQKPVLVSETPLMSNEADSGENTVPLAMIEDNAMMQGEELINAPESNEAMIDEMSVHEEMISVHEFKNVLDEVINDAVGKIVMKKAGIVGKLKTAKQNLIGHDGEVTARDPQQLDNRVATLQPCILMPFHSTSCPVCICQCDPETFDEFGRGNCNSLQDGKEWCFLKEKSFCMDQKPSKQVQGRFWSNEACSIKRQLSETRNTL